MWSLSFRGAGFDVAEEVAAVVVEWVQDSGQHPRLKHCCLNSMLSRDSYFDVDAVEEVLLSMRGYCSGHRSRHPLASCLCV